MPTYLITEQQRQLLAEYLSHHPWREVNQLIAMISQLPQAPVVKGQESGD